MSDCSKCRNVGIISWLDSCGCCMSEKYCDCPAGIEAQKEAETVAEFKKQYRAEQKVET